MIRIKAEHIITPEGILDNHSIVFDETIRKILPNDETYDGVTQEYVFDGYVSAGFIDVHIHGSGGSDVMDATPEALSIITKTVAKGGTTAMLATTMTMSEEEIIKALHNVRSYMKGPQDQGATILGVHLEGPFISKEFKGAQDPSNIQKPTDRWLEEFHDIVKIITVAPEEDENFQMIRKWSEKGIIVSLGHTAADYELAKEAYHAGARHITHCYNAMKGLHHRQPGLVGAALILPFTIELITDKIHVHKDLIGPTVQWKGTDKSILITDAMRAAFLPEGQYDLGGQEVTVKNNKCTLKDGTIAGSVHRLDYALKNMVDCSSVEFVDIIKMLTENPAKLIGAFERKGSLEEGKDADIILIDKDYTIQKTIVAGKTVFEV